MVDMPRKGQGAAIHKGGGRAAYRAVCRARVHDARGRPLPCKGDEDGTQAEGESPSIPASIGNHGTYHDAIGPESVLAARRAPERSTVFDLIV